MRVDIHVFQGGLDCGGCFLYCKEHLRRKLCSDLSRYDDDGLLYRSLYCSSGDRHDDYLESCSGQLLNLYRNEDCYLGNHLVSFHHLS